MAETPLGPREKARLTFLVNQMFGNAFGGRMRSRQGADPDTRRDVEAECGHPKHFSAEQYYDLCRRDAITHKALTILPRGVWSVWPTVYELESS
jgi:hypothetical protein